MTTEVSADAANAGGTAATVPITDELPVVRPMAAAIPPRAEAARRQPWRWALLALAILVTFAVGYYALSLWQVWSTGRADESQPVDAIVVMGAAQYDGRPSPQLAARLDHAAALWPEDVAPLIVVTGGSQPGDRFTEAEASAAYLTELGVPEDAVVLENTGTNTVESLDGVAQILDAQGLESVLIVTDPYHALRSKLTAEEAGLTAYVSSTPTSIVDGSQSVRRHLGEAAGVAAGRIIGFDRLSGIIG